MAVSFFSKTERKTERIGYYNPLYGNYVFDVELTYFGIMKERKFRKVNRKGSILKLDKVLGVSSIYPMIDEFGYTFSDFFIFKSAWDFEYYIETIV
jgi:hypothetical protein